MSKIDTVAGSYDLLCVQEVSRGKDGWDEHETDCFLWFSHQDASQWRGVGIGVSRDLFDCVTDKVACKRGAAWVVRLKNHKRIILCSLHCPTGVTVGQYHQDVHDFRRRLRRWHPDLPLVAGVDANEVVGWNSDEADGACIRSSSKLDKLLEATSGMHLRPVPPRREDRNVPTHYPRDESREGRHIDAIFVRMVGGGQVSVKPEMRLEINTDHALLEMHIEIHKTRPAVWVDSRPRWVACDGVLPVVSDFNGVQALARQVCQPKRRKDYRDDDEMRQLLRDAKQADWDDKKAMWKKVHRTRRRKKREWQQQRLSNILYGSWGEYRDYKASLRKKSWWGDILSGKTSDEVADEVQQSLGAKFWDVARNWGDELQRRIQDLPIDDACLMPIMPAEVSDALAGMKARSAVGEDQVCVDLLRRLAQEQPEHLCGMCTEVLTNGVLPEPWGVSLLALLPKCQCPALPSDLRPIAMGSAAMKMMSRIVMGRTFDKLREPCRHASSGKGRQPADLVGTFTRLRDVTREWRTGVIAAKLDVKGAFDYIDRGKVADFLQARLRDPQDQHALRFLLLLLAENTMKGCAPGGKQVVLTANRGIRQGSPESAELFGMIIAFELQKIRDAKSWAEPGGDIDDIPVDVGCFQDDIFLWSDSGDRLERNIAKVAVMLKGLGLSLSANKTCIVVNQHYRGKRRIKVDSEVVEVGKQGTCIRVLGVDFDFDAGTSQQCREMMGRIWDAFYANKPILCGHGSWGAKVNMTRSLVEGTWAWTAGALHWSRDDLMMLNSIQLRLYRMSFGIHRKRDEDWTEFNKRSLRTIRYWMCTQGVERWSTKVCRLQHALLGHWSRRREGSSECMPALMLGWRSLSWWRKEQKLAKGKRHPHRFHADNVERDVATALGLEWKTLTADRVVWKGCLSEWLAHKDVPWTRGRQPELCDA